MLPVLWCAAGADAAGKTPTLSDIQLKPNPHSWSKTASVLYIDSPAGTGFSYSDKTSDYVTNDKLTIDDLEVFVARFFQQYKQLRQLQLYIAGGTCWVFERSIHVELRCRPSRSRSSCSSRLKKLGSCSCKAAAAMCRS
jgi:hypothetical protein